MLNVILDAVISLTLPVGVPDTPQTKALFEQGKDKVRSYHGQPRPLLEALALFAQSSESYAYIGIAQVIVSASYQSGDNYDHEGLGKAIGWLDKTRQLPHDSIEVTLTEVEIRTCFQHYAKAHQLLDALLQQEPQRYEASAARLVLYCHEQNTAQAETLFGHLFPLANEMQKKHLYHNLYALYARAGLTDKAREVLAKILYLEPDNPWIHHNMSILYLKLGKLRESKKHNTAALKLMTFPAALIVQQELRRITWKVRRHSWSRGAIVVLGLIFVLGFLGRMARTSDLTPQNNLRPEREFLSRYIENQRACINLESLSSGQCQHDKNMLEECIVTLGKDSMTCQHIATAASLFSETRDNDHAVGHGE